MIAIGIHHVSFAVRDIDRARRFYEEILGLERIPRPDLGFPGEWYAAGNAEIHLIQPPDGVDVGANAPSLTPLANHHAFAVEDYEKTVAHFRSRRIDVIATSPQVGQMWVRDPDGNVLEFITAR